LAPGTAPATISHPCVICGAWLSKSSSISSGP
jgi:hypothetical protein